MAVANTHGYLMKGKKLQVDFASLKHQEEFYENLNELLSEISYKANSVTYNDASQSPEKENQTITQGVDTTSFAFGDITDNRYLMNPNDPRCKLISNSSSHSMHNFQWGSVVHYKHWNDSIHHTHSAQILKSHEPMSLPLPQFAMHHYKNSVLNPQHNNKKSSGPDGSKYVNPDKQNFTDKNTKIKKYCDEWFSSSKSVSDTKTFDRFKSNYKCIKDINNIQPSNILKYILAKPGAFTRDTERLEYLLSKHNTEYKKTNFNLPNVQDEQLRSSSLLMPLTSSVIHTEIENNFDNLNNRNEYIKNWLQSIDQQNNEPIDQCVNTFQNQKLNDKKGEKEEVNIQHKNVEQISKVKINIQAKTAVEENQPSKLPSLKSTNIDKINFTGNDNIIKSILFSSIENVNKKFDSNGCKFEEKNSNQPVRKLSDAEKNVDYVCIKNKSVLFDHAIVEDKTKEKHEPKMILVPKSKEIKNKKNEKLEFSNIIEIKKNTNEEERLVTDITKTMDNKKAVIKLDKTPDTKNDNNQKSYINNSIYKKDDVNQTLQEKEKSNGDRFINEGREKSVNQQKNSKQPEEHYMCSLKRRVNDCSENLDVRKRPKIKNKNANDKNNVSHISQVSETSSSGDKEQINEHYERKAKNNTDERVVVNTRNEIKHDKNGERMRSHRLRENKKKNEPFILSMYNKVNTRATGNKQTQEKKQCREKCSRLKRFKTKSGKNNVFHESDSYDTDPDFDPESDDRGLD